MIGSANREEASRDEIGSLSAGDSFASRSYSSYRSAMITLSDSEHFPLSPSIVATPADSDPLLAPPPPLSPPISSSDSPNISSLKPASYAELILSPLDDGGDTGEVNGVESPSGSSDKSMSLSRYPSSISGDYLNVSVSNPQKEVESSNSLVPGGNAFITYLIVTETNLPEFGGSEFNVRRRFKDVVTLSDRLSESYRGFIIPPRPDKSVVESQVMQKQEFVEQRRVALERYLRRLAKHPVIRRSDELRVFLQVQGKLPLATSVDVASRMLDGAVKLPKQLFGDSSNVVEPQDVVQPARGGRDLLRIFKELKQSVANDWVGSRPAVEEEDKDFIEKKERLHDFEQQLNNTSKQAETLVKAQQDLGDTMGELGLAFLKLSKFENERAVLNVQRARAADMKNLSTAAVKASRFYRALNAHSVKNLDILHDYMGLMLAFQSACADRSNALLTVQTLLSELSTLHAKVGKLEAASSKIFGGDKSRIHKLEELKEAIRTTEDAKNCAIREYERIKGNNRSEIERLERERKVELVEMLKGFVTNQVAYYGKVGDEWAKVAEETREYVKEKDGAL